MAPQFLTHLEEKKSTFFKETITISQLHSLFTLHYANFLQFFFPGHKIEKKVEIKLGEVTILKILNVKVYVLLTICLLQQLFPLML